MSVPFVPTPEDTHAARLQLEQMRLQPASLPTHLAALVTEVLTTVAAGKAVQVTVLDTEITTQQAAELLGVSRPYLVKLVEAGALPHRKVGPRRRLHLEDVLAYQARLDASRRAALQALADDLQDLGLD